MLKLRERKGLEIENSMGESVDCKFLQYPIKVKWHKSYILLKSY